MSPKPFKTRFAPSPTGYLHLGNARTALFNALLARKREGIFLLRIEDTDRGRGRAEYVRALQEDLRWLGLDWQEGPDRESTLGPYSQSLRSDIYASHYDRLIEGGFAYPCFCSEQELQQIRKAQLAAGQPPRYPGTCARLTARETQDKLDQGLRPVLRFRMPADELAEFEDLVRGPQRYRTSEIGDFVIRRSDLTPAFFFCNAVDDALMGVTHVLRGEDHLANTPRQLMVLRALGYEPPAYGHIALLTGSDGAPLSKRRGATSVRELREQGYLPEAVTNYLARLGHVYEQIGFLSPAALVEGFDLSRLGRAPAHFDQSQLRYWQKEAIMHALDGALWTWLAESPDGTGLEGQVPARHRLQFVAVVRHNIELPPDALAWAQNVYSELPRYSAEARHSVRLAGGKLFECALAHLPSTAADFKSYAQSVGNAAGVKGKDLYMPLRAALTGETHGPEMARLFPLIGIERARARLQAAVRIAKDKPEHAADLQ